MYAKKSVIEAWLEVRRFGATLRHAAQEAGIHGSEGSLSFNRPPLYQTRPVVLRQENLRGCVQLCPPSA
jgi:hypothetical protein